MIREYDPGATHVAIVMEEVTDPAELAGASAGRAVSAQLGLV